MRNRILCGILHWLFHAPRALGEGAHIRFKAELERAGMTYTQLAELIGDNEANVRNKLSRGKLSVALLL